MLFIHLFFFRFTLSIFSFYVWENTLENFHNQIRMFGGLVLVINTLIATSAILGIIGIRKKMSILVRTFAFGLGCYLVYWICWILILSIFSHHFTVSDAV